MSDTNVAAVARKNAPSEQDTKGKQADDQEKAEESPHDVCSLSQVE
jgi:hypothetical protein